MIRLPLAVALSALAAVLSAFAAAAADSVPEGVFFPKTFRLENGLEVVVVENRRAPVVVHQVWYKVGSADEERGKSGLAHFLEHLMFKGTATVPPGAFSRRVARVGGSDNAFTSWDYTAYVQTLDSAELELVMRMEADRMTGLVLSDEVVLPERDVILEERAQVVESNPSARLGEETYATLFANHPYGTPIIGWRHEMATLTTEDALAFYRRWYAPNNAVLIVVGDVDAGEVERLARKHYGPVASRAVPERRRPAEPKLAAAKRVELVAADVRLPSVRRMWIAPTYGSAGKELAPALQLLSEILGGSTGPLYERLVVATKLAASAGAYYDGSGLDPSTFMVFATPLPESDIAAVERELAAEVARVVKDGITEAQLAEAKRRLIDGAALIRDGIDAPARILGESLTTGEQLAEIERWPRTIDAVTVADIRLAIAAVLARTDHVTGIMRPSVEQRAETK